MEIYSLPKAHIAKLNKSTVLKIMELICSILDEKTSALRKRQGSQVITIVSSQRKFTFDHQVN
jgi:hypothetical protein